MPLVIPIAYYFILPQPEAFTFINTSSFEEEEVDAPYAPLPTDEDAIDVRKTSVSLTLEDKWVLVKPLLLRYMLPLCMWFHDSSGTAADTFQL